MSNATAEIIRVTPEMAKQWLGEKQYPRQRPLRDRHITFLSKEMSDGEFLECHTTINEMSHAGRDMIINGQHRLNAVVDSKVPIHFTVIRSIASSIDEVDKAYGKMDIQGMRTFYDATISMGLEGFHVTTKKDINLMYTSLAKLYKGFMIDGMRDSNYIMYKKVMEWSIYGKQYLGFLEGLPNSLSTPMRRSWVVAVALATMRFSDGHLNGSKSSADFWSRVASGEMLARKDPRMVLHNIIAASQLRDYGRKAANITPKVLAAKCAIAWKAYIQNKEMSFIRTPKNVKVPISHTPFDYSMTIAQHRQCFEESDWGDDWPST